MKGKKLTLSEFIHRSNIIHNNKYNYCLTLLQSNIKQKVKIICPIHGEFEQTPDNHLSGNGCKRCAGVKLKTTHGLRYHKYYPIWDGMMQRCLNDKSTSYKNYGSRGISVSEEFKNCEKFISYIESLPNYSEGKQIDRINNDGNYEKGNLRWATKQEQSFNTRVRIDNNSRYTGVSKLKNKEKWRAYIFLSSNNQIHIGTFNTIKEAVFARNNYIIKNNLKHKIQKYENNL